jgi:hypothetical protein
MLASGDSREEIGYKKSGSPIQSSEPQFPPDRHPVGIVGADLQVNGIYSLRPHALRESDGTSMPNASSLHRDS